MDSIVIVGYSGHSYVVIDAIVSLDKSIIGYYEQHEVKKNPFNFKYLGSEKQVDNLQILNDTNTYFFVTIGNNSLREIAFKYLQSLNHKAINIFHPKSTVSENVKLGIGIFISANAIVNSFSEIGNAAIINTGSVIEHECIIGDFSHIAPGAVLLGNVSIGANCLVGANAVVKQGISIGANSIIGAGAVVVKNVPSGEVWVGNPAKRMK